MKLLFDFFPVLLFFIAYKVTDIFVATAVAIAASVVQVGWTWYKERKLHTGQLVTFGLITVLGGATLYLQDETFIKWKPTVVNWLFGIAFLISQFVGKKTLIERMMSSAITLPNRVWMRLNLSWVVFFLVLGLTNVYVISNYDTETWVNFKLFGMFGMTLTFIIVQGIFLGRYVKEDANANATADEKK